MTFPKVWEDEPSVATPINAAGLINLEQRVHDEAVNTISTKRGQANGYASLDGSGKVPTAQLPTSGGGSGSSWTAGLRSARPAAGTLGAMFLATDQVTLWLDTGTTWIPMGPSPGDFKFSGANSGSPDPGWLLGDGSAISRAGVNADMFAKLGTKWGVGNGSTTFNLPNFQGRAIVAAGTGAGLSARNPGQVFGEESHAMTAQELYAHMHIVYEPGSGFLNSTENIATSPGGSGFYKRDVTGPALQTSVSGGNTPFNVCQPSGVAVLMVKI